MVWFYIGSSRYLLFLYHLISYLLVLILLYYRKIRMNQQSIMNSNLFLWNQIWWNKDKCGSLIDWLVGYRPEASLPQKELISLISQLIPSTFFAFIPLMPQRRKSRNEFVLMKSIKEKQAKLRREISWMEGCWPGNL